MSVVVSIQIRKMFVEVRKMSLNARGAEQDVRGRHRPDKREVGSSTLPMPMIFTVLPRKRLGAGGVFFFIAIEQKCQRGADADPGHGGDPVERRRTSQHKCRGHKNQPCSE